MTVTLITGCSTGIGQVTALHLARQGHHVFASMRNPATGSAPLIQAAQDEALRLDVIQLDVNDPLSSERAVNLILEQAGQLDVLVNNAGISGGGPVEDAPEEVLRAVFETNFFGPMRLMRLVVPKMRQAQRGAIVNVTSIMGRITLPGLASYGASKHALEVASETLAMEVRRFNIRVAIIEPGVIQTPHHEGPRRELDPNSPYHEFFLRARRATDSRLKDPSPPELVAETIQHALETDQPKLRYLVGDDAKGWAAGREAMTDEEWVAHGREMTLDEYAAFSLAKFGIEI